MKESLQIKKLTGSGQSNIKYKLRGFTLFSSRYMLFSLLSLLLFSSSLSAQVPVTFHFKPDYAEFEALRLVGTFNSWNNADDNLLMTDNDGDGEYEVTINLAEGVIQNYKFVMNADWGLAFTDPDNPEINVADNNNSIISVKDPMITYLLPRDINSKDEVFIDNSPEGLPIRVIFAFTDSNPIDLNTLTLNIDGTDISDPDQYFDAVKKELLYTPDPPLSTGEHTVTVNITSGQGTDSRSSTFIRDPDYVAYQIPTDFYFDENNSSVTFTQTVNNVALVGVFNNWNDSFNPLQDSDNDGLWEGTAVLTPGEHEYKFKLNNIFWTNDPDETRTGTTADANSITVVTPDSIPALKLIQPTEQTIYYTDPAPVNLQVMLRPGIKSSGADINTIEVLVDGALQSFTYDTITSVVTSDFNLSGEGRHSAEVSYANEEGLQVSEKYTFGIYTKDTGVLIVDAENDEPYTYPAGTDSSCDILSVSIDETPGHDSLQFSINLKKINDRTRVAFIISNSSDELIDAPAALDIKTMDWNGQGIFIALGKPGNLFENPAVENRIMTGSNPPVYSDFVLEPDSSAAAENSFNFVLPLALLDSIIGSWTEERFFYAFSYLALEDASGNSFEVTPAEGGSANFIDPDIYDAAFIRSGFWQKRMLSNYIQSGETGGPRYAALDGSGRGILSLTAGNISDSLATFGPAITFLTPPAEYWYPDLTIYGELSDSAITSVTTYFNNFEEIIPAVNGTFSIPVTLEEGENIFYAAAEDSRGYKSTSKDLVLTYTPDNLPSATISALVNGREVTLTANASSPSGTTFFYTWSADRNNPSIVNISSSTETAVINIPATAGEYFFNVRVRDARNKIVFPRIMIVSTPDSVFIPDINYHSSWIDNAIVYEIYPRSFSGQGNFQGISEKTEYLKDLGINTIWLMPIYKGPTTHGYEITDYYDFEEDYGNESSFRTMLSTLKNNGIRVILDYVVNHTSVSHPFMQNVFSYNEYSPYAGFYLWDAQPGNSGYDYYFDWTSLPNLNHENPDVRKYFINAAKYWVSYYGIDGYRCDVAWGVEERNSDFWQEWRAALKNIKPEILLEAEAGSDQPVFYQQRFDSANDWELRKKLIAALDGSGTLASLHQEVTRDYPEYARPFRFIENHDETRAASLFDIKRSLLMHTIVFTLNGIPLIYSGGEVGELTRREMITWSDPENVKPYFRNLISIRKSFVHNPEITLISNTDNANVYSYSSVSGNHTLVTAANFRGESKNVEMDLSALPHDGSEIYYLTDLTGGAVYEVPLSQRNNVPLSLTEYQAKIFYFGPDSVTVNTDDLSAGNIPLEYKLHQNFPNPFNPLTKIRFQIKDAGRVSIKIYDILGSEAAVLLDEMKVPGIYEVDFNASGLSSGVYFYRLKTDKFTAVKKLMLIK